MSNPVIKVEKVSKKFIISHEAPERYKSLRDVMVKKAKNFIGKGNLVQNEVNEEFFALKDINFEVNAGDRLGIIGRNGAGKSTLLKVLSRITNPTSGRITIRGRVASLLEVGTGFHPELTGRENVYLNGAILGMSRAEIRKKFDEIVDFAGVEKFLDTPVKRYSSGMYVRLAFAVAAHLEPEILIVDEVLAVGDAEFQKKCLGKMQDVSKNGGRTILFVSHNMSAIQSLCNRGILLNEGRNVTEGLIEFVIEKYQNYSINKGNQKYWDNIDGAPGNENAKIKAVVLKNAENTNVFDVRTPLIFETEFWNLIDNVVINLSFHLNKFDGTTIFNIGSPAVLCHKGIYKGRFTIPGNFLNNGLYSITLMIIKGNTDYFSFDDCLNFEIEDYREGTSWFGNWKGAVRPTFIDFSLTRI
jgi:lipopolysaccharide transport system ATP-binding protein